MLLHIWHINILSIVVVSLDGGVFNLLLSGYFRLQRLSSRPVLVSNKRREVDEVVETHTRKGIRTIKDGILFIAIFGQIQNV